MRWQWDDFFVRRCPGLNPASQERQLLGRELIVLSRRHLSLRDQVDEQAAFRLAPNHGRAILTPTQDFRERPQVELGFLRVTTMTVVTLRGEQRPDVLLERRGRRQHGVLHGELNVQSRPIPGKWRRSAVRMRIHNEIEKVTDLDLQSTRGKVAALFLGAELQLAARQDDGLNSAIRIRRRTAFHIPGDARTRLGMLKATLDSESTRHGAFPAHDHRVLRAWRDDDVTAPHRQTASAILQHGGHDR